jgi:hypothetical protein
MEFYCKIVEVMPSKQTVKKVIAILTSSLAGFCIQQVTFKGKYCVYHTFLRIYLVKKVPYL